MVQESYERERVREVVQALDRLWSATDYPEARNISQYSEDELKQFLGEWIHVRKACNRIFEKIRESRPELPGWDPMGKEVPVEQRLADADGPPESLSSD